MRQQSAFDLIPLSAKVLAALMFAVPAVVFTWLAEDHFTIGGATAVGVLAGIFLAGFVLLSGYIYADASRRGMSPLPWTLLGFLVPNGIGFVLYFLLRKPLVHACPRCRGGVAVSAAFCPACGQSQAVPMGGS
jgi:hypothetical protein